MTTLSELPKYTNYAESEKSLPQRIHKPLRMRMKRAGAIATRVTLASALTLGAAEYLNMQVSKITTPQYSTSLENVADNSAANRPIHTIDIYFAGLGQVSAVNPAKMLESAEKERHDEVIAVRYSNKGVNEEKIAEEIVQKTQKDDISKINGVGISSGGNIMLKVFSKVSEKTKGKVRFGNLTEIDSPTTADTINVNSEIT